MRTARIAVLALLGLACLARSTSAAPIVLVDKAPDPAEAFGFLDGFGSPNGADAHFVLAGSFVFTGATGTLLLSKVGVYMQRFGDGPVAGVATPFEFDVFADHSGSPNPPQILQRSGPPTGLGPIDFLSDPNGVFDLTLVTGSLFNPIPLVNGVRYWIGVSTFVGGTLNPWSGAYIVGLHTQTNPNDGNLWAYDSFVDPGSAVADLFNDLFAVPGELAIYAEANAQGAVPEPATLTLISTGVLGLVARQRRRAAA